MKSITKIYLLLSVSCLILSCQPRVDTNELMLLNRNGQWNEVKEKSLKSIEKLNDYSTSEICELYFNLSYSLVRLGDYNLAGKYIGKFNISAVINTLN